MFLTQQDIQDLTGKVRFAAQRRALQAMGYKFTMRIDGSPVVLVSEVERHQATPRRPRRTEPDFTAVD